MLVGHFTDEAPHPYKGEEIRYGYQEKKFVYGKKFTHIDMEDLFQQDCMEYINWEDESWWEIHKQEFLANLEEDKKNNINLDFLNKLPLPDSPRGKLFLTVGILSCLILLCGVGFAFIFPRLIVVGGGGNLDSDTIVIPAPPTSGGGTANTPVVPNEDIITETPETEWFTLSNSEKIKELEEYLEQYDTGDNGVSHISRIEIDSDGITIKIYTDYRSSSEDISIMAQRAGEIRGILAAFPAFISNPVIVKIYDSQREEIGRGTSEEPQPETTAEDDTVSP